MYVTCKNCSTSFLVDDVQIGIHGRRVRCSNCQNIWHCFLNYDSSYFSLKNQNLSNSFSIVDSNKVKLPALLPNKVPLYLYIVPVLLISMIILMCVIMFPNAFNISSVVNNKHLKIEDVNIVYNGDVDKLFMEYKLSNMANKRVKMPLVRVRLLNQNSKVLKTKFIKLKDPILFPKQSLKVETQIFPVPIDTEDIDIMIGNKLDFLLG